MPTPSAAPPDRILAAAAVVFAESGYAGASMTVLARRCGVSKALLYHYFAGKDDILFRLLDAYTTRLIALCSAVVERRLPPGDHFDALVTTLLVEYRTSRNVHKVILQDVDHLPAGRRRKIRAQEREVVEYFRAAIARAFLANADERRLTTAAMMVLGMINWTFTWLNPAGPLGYEDFARAVLAVCRGGLAQLPAPGGGRIGRRARRGRGLAVKHQEVVSQNVESGDGSASPVP